MLWREMYQEFAMLIGAMLPAIVIARFEGRSVGDYGLPPRQAFGKLFWLGAVWGLAAITVLLITLRAVQVFYFGPVVLHGVRVLKFALFWGTYFRDGWGLRRILFARVRAATRLARGWGFWPAAIALSVLFGAIHMRNPGET